MSNDLQIATLTIDQTAVQVRDKENLVQTNLLNVHVKIKMPVLSPKL